MSSTAAPPLAPDTPFRPFSPHLTEVPQQAKPARGGLWREEVLDRAGRLMVDLTRLARDHVGDPQLVTAWELVADAMLLTEGWVTPAQWWSGSRIEDCWRRLRQAEEAMLDLGSPEEKLANAREAGNHARFYLGEQDPRTKNLMEMLADDALVADDMVPTARIALAASHETSDRQHRESRSFINSLRVTILLLAVLLGAFVLAVEVGELTLVPAVGTVTQPVLVGVAVLFGALGAMFSAIPSLAQMPSKAQTFNPVRTQAVLKVVVGAWSAVIGLLAVEANLATADTKNLAGFAMVAAIFGASQEALTRFADRKARDLGTSDGAGFTSS
jgi:hypothetical protein